MEGAIPPSPPAPQASTGRTTRSEDSSLRKPHRGVKARSTKDERGLDEPSPRGREQTRRPTPNDSTDPTVAQRPFRVTKPGNRHATPHGLTYEQAAAILGCHVSNVVKLVTKGQLTSRGRVRDGALDRSEVEALAQRRAQEREALAARPRRKHQRMDPRPDHEHEWLSPRQVAELLGVTRPAVQARIHRGTLPAVGIGGRFWVRRDLLEQVEAARLVGGRGVP